jgi:hypothetical protein
MAAAQFDTNGITINGEVRRDLSALLSVLAFLSMFVVVGLFLIAYARLVRVVAGENRLTIYNVWNRPVFDSPWSEIDGYEYTARSDRNWKNFGWRVSACTRSAAIPMVESYAHLQYELLKRIPANAVKHPARPEPYSHHLPDRIKLRLRNSRDAYAAVFSCVWYAGATAIIVVGASEGFKAGVVQFAVFICVPIAFALIPYGTFKKSWLRLLRGSIDIDPEGVRYDDGTGPVSIPWEQVRLVEAREAVGDEDANDVPLIIVGSEAAIQIAGCVPQLDLIRRMAFNYAGESAILLASR